MGHTAGSAETAMVAGENAAQISGGAVLIVGDTFHHHGDSSGRIPFIGNLGGGFPSQFPCALFDGAFNGVIRHVLSARRIHGGA